MDFTGKYIESTYQKVLHIHSGSVYDGTGSYVSPTFSGSVSVIGDVVVTSGSVYVDGEMLGGAADTASYALYAITSSYALNSITSSYALNSITSSYALNAGVSGSDYLVYSNRSNYFTGSQDIFGSLTITDNLIVDGNITANQYIVSSSVTYMTQSFSSGSTLFGDSIDDTHVFTGSIYVTGSLLVGGGTPTNLLQVILPSNTSNTSKGIELTKDDDFFRLVNGASGTTAFAPTFDGRSSGVGLPGLLFNGWLNTSSTTTPTVLFRTRNSAGNTAINNDQISFAFDNFTNRLVTVLGNGNVGIGTELPSYLLDVSGSSRQGSSLNDSHTFTGSVYITGSLITEDIIVSGSAGVNYFGTSVSDLHYFTGSVRINGSLYIDEEQILATPINSISSSYAITSSYAENGTVILGTPDYFPIFTDTGDNIEDSIMHQSGSNIVITGSLVTSTTTGLNVFGNSPFDQHAFTGSVNITGSLLVNGLPPGQSASVVFPESYFITSSYATTMSFSNEGNIVYSCSLEGDVHFELTDPKLGESTLVTVLYTGEDQVVTYDSTIRLTGGTQNSGSGEWDHFAFTCVNKTEPRYILSIISEQV